MRRRGFTLIELLVVISIIALLLAIMMPALGMVKEKARTVVCGSNQRQTGLTLLMYGTDNDQEVPEPAMWSRVGSPGSGFFIWGDRMFYEFRYMQSTEQLYCPSSKIPPGCAKKWDPALTENDFRTTDPFKWSGHWTYGLRVPDFGGNVGGARSPEPIRLNRIKRPSSYYLLTDTSYKAQGQQAVAAQKYQYYLFDYNLSFFMLHSEGANVLMADGSVSRKRDSEIANDIKRGIIGPFAGDPFVYPDGESKRLEDVLQ